MWRKLLYALPLLVVLSGLLTGAQCFPRQCRTHEHCQRLCECKDNTTNTVLQCPMFFQCNVESGVCADEYNMGCDEICGRFAATGTCGSKTCENEAQCVRSAVCQATNQQTGETCQYNCEVTFACEQDIGACEAGFAVDDNTLCQSCPPTC